MQVYKNFPILTSQPSKSLQKSIKHHMYGYFDTNKSYNGSIWLKDTVKKINQIILEKKTPIIVGGTGLYLEFISSGISHIPNISKETKDKVKELFVKKGYEEMFYFLREVDPEYADKININDKFRINRALEVFQETKKNISYFHKKRIENNNYNFFKVFLAPSKEIIKINIKVRLEKMLKQGVLEEFNKNNIKVKSCNIQKAIGYQEINDYFKNKISLSEMSKKIIFSTKKYSKRQFTWFNNRYNANLKIDSIKKSSLILESLSKII